MRGLAARTPGRKRSFSTWWRLWSPKCHSEVDVLKIFDDIFMNSNGIQRRKLLKMWRLARQDADQQHRQMEQLGGSGVHTMLRLRLEEQKEQLRDLEEPWRG